jgi:uncharacterized protein (DUF4415 family)
MTYLYAIGVFEGPVKIGFTKSPRERLSTIKTASPVSVQMLACFDVGDLHSEVERTMHFILRDERQSGEWFNITADRAIEAIETMGTLTKLPLVPYSPPHRKPSLNASRPAALFPKIRDKPHREYSKPGPKPSGKAKQLITLRLDPDVIDGFKSSGDGWQSRMNQALRAHLGIG